MEVITCGVCHKNFKSKSSLKQHTTEIHGNVRYHCLLCTYDCSRVATLKRHNKIVHDKIKEYHCQLCNYTATLKYSLVKHEETCNGDFRGSSGEFEIIQILNELKVDYVYDQPKWGVKDIKQLRWDFIINPDHMFPSVIEFDGGFHYKPIRMGRQTQEQAQTAFESAQRRDKIKDEYAEDNAIIMIRIPYWEQKNLKRIVSEFVRDYC